MAVNACADNDGAPDVPEGSLAEVGYEFTIPLGSAERIWSGEEVEVLPPDLDVWLDDVI